MPAPTAILHMLCGLPGAGKSTFGHRLAAERSALYLSPDPWLKRLYGEEFSAANRDKVERLQWELALEVAEFGQEVIVDFGFWSKAERDRFRKEATARSLEVKLYFLDVPLAELQRRITARNAALPAHCFRVETESLEAWAREFEPPTPEENAILV